MPPDLYGIAGVALFAAGFAGGYAGDRFRKHLLSGYQGEPLKQRIRDLVCVAWMAFFWIAGAALFSRQFTF